MSTPPVADRWGERLPRRLGLLSAWAVAVGIAATHPRAGDADYGGQDNPEIGEYRGAGRDEADG